MIQVRSLRVDYENVTAVSDLDLEIPLGQIYGLVGPNGAGKTSTLKALAGLLEPTYAEIKICGIDLEINPEEALRHLAFMPDFPPVYENLKVWEYLDVFGAAYLIEKETRRKKAKYWIDRVDLTEKWNSYIRDLSRGMRQRLVLAKTLLHEPDVILLDEPASGLDPLARMEMRTILKNIAQDKRTIIISSHILTELSDLCDAVGIMEKGKMVVSGTIDHIRKTVGATGTLVIELLETSEQTKEELRKILESFQKTGQIAEEKPFHITMPFYGQISDAACILKELVTKQIPITQFYVKEANVEDIFFKVGAKEVS